MSTEQRSEAEKERRRRVIQLGSAAAFLAVVVIAVLIVIGQSQTDGGDTDIEGVGAVRQELAGIPQQGLTLGEPDAPVKLVEFGDLQCPVCKGFAEEVIPGVIDSRVRSGEAKIEFRNFTIISEESVPAAAAAVAAGEQGRGWEFIELFYRNQGIERSGYVTDHFLTEIARGAGVPDIERWDSDRESRRVLGVVSAQTAEAERLGLEGTPSFAVEGPATKGLEVQGFLESTAEIEAVVDAASG